MLGKSDTERLERLEVEYAFVREAFVEIRSHLARQNGHIDELRRFRIQVMAVIATLAAMTSIALGTAGVAVALLVS